VLAVMQKLVEEGMTMITVTHEMNFARRFADRIMYMDEGRFVEIAPPEEMFTSPRDERTRLFLSHLHVKK
jgi:ABC-type polar amino acid transport system ATPase subunit